MIEYLKFLFIYRNNNSFIQYNWTDLGTDWAPTIVDKTDEGFVLEHAVSQSCLYNWIGGSANTGPPISCPTCTRHISGDKYFTNYSGTRQAVLVLKFIYISLLAVHFKIEYVMRSLSYICSVKLHFWSSGAYRISRYYGCGDEYPYSFEVTESPITPRFHTICEKTQGKLLNYFFIKVW